VALLLSLLFAGLTGVGCGPPSLRGFSLVELRDEYAGFPGGFQALMEMAEERYRPGGPPEDVVLSLRAACKAVDLNPRSARANFLAGRSCFWLQDFGKQPVCYHPGWRELELADCVSFGERAVELDRSKGEYYYYLGLSLGIKMRTAFIYTKIVNLGHLIDILKRAVEMDAGVDEGGPLRVLGALYLKAPPWPRGPGDMDKALDLLAKAVSQYPNHPLNHYFYAEALLEDEEDADAVEQVNEAVATSDKELNWRGVKYRKMALTLKKKIEDSRP